MAHIGEEVLKNAPAVANRYPATAVASKTRMVWVCATLNNILPDPMDPLSCQSVFHF
jgi:hypothetical protein